MKLNNLSLYLLTVLIWGSTWIGVEFQLPENGVNIAPEVSVFYRYCICLLYTSPSPRDQRGSRMPSSA